LIFVKVFISFDMEGVAGIVDWSQCRAPGQPYEEGRALLLGEVNAAIDGALAGGRPRSSATTRTGRWTTSTRLTCTDVPHTSPGGTSRSTWWREKIYAAAAAATLRAGSITPPDIALPATLDVELRTADMAQVACWISGVERSGTRSVRIEADDPVAAYKAFVGVTYITRVAEGR
jgi:D-aminopeptidase